MSAPAPDGAGKYKKVSARFRSLTISMKNKITIDIDDLIIFQGVSKAHNKPYCLVQFKRHKMFDTEYVEQFKKAGVKVWGMSDIEV